MEQSKQSFKKKKEKLVNLFRGKDNIASKGYQSNSGQCKERK